MQKFVRRTKIISKEIRKIEQNISEKLGRKQSTYALSMVSIVEIVMDGYHKFAKMCKKSESNSKNNKMRRVQGIKVESKKYDVFSVQSLHNVCTC